MTAVKNQILNPMVAALVEKCQAGYPALYLVSSEDTRSLVDIKEAAAAMNRALYVWTFAKGATTEGAKKPLQNTESPYGILDEIPSLPRADGHIIVLRRFHHFLEDPQVQAKLVDLIPVCKDSRKTVIILTPVQRIPAELEKDLTLMDSPLPTKETLERVWKGILEASKIPESRRPSEQLLREIIDAASGLTTSEAENVFSLSLTRSAKAKKTTLGDPQAVLEEKCAALKKSGLLEYIPTKGVGMDSVGGMTELKQWVSLRKRAFTEEARNFGLPPPKGILMVGPPGSGKSLGAKAVGAELGLPVIRCDFGKLLGSLVGQSEGNMRKAIETAEAMSPCVFWIDEIEKALAGSSSGATDSGVGARLLGYMLTWMQEKTTPVFVYATANDVKGLPPELLRKGRFDEMWSVLLPTHSERKEILDIHLRKRNRQHLIGKRPAIDLEHFAANTNGFSGAEIEAVIVEALYKAFDAKSELTFRHLQEAIDTLQPLSKTMKERILELETWCKNRTRPANGATTESVQDIMFGRKIEAEA